MSDRTMINRDELLKQICEYLEPWILSEDDRKKIDEKTNLLNDLGIDSVGIMQLLLGVERDYHIVIPEHELDNDVFSRLGNFLNLVESKINEAG